MHTQTSSRHARFLAVSLTILTLLAASTHPVLAKEPAPIRNTVPIAQLQGDALQIADVSSTTGVASVLPSDQTYVYEESFDTYTHRDLTSTTADWDVFSGELSGAQHKALWWQFSPATALGSDGSLFMVWEDERNDSGDIYMQKYDVHGDRLWAVDRRVNSDIGPTEQADPDITVGPDGCLYIAWVDRGSDGATQRILAQKMDDRGQRIWASDVQVDDGRTSTIWDVKVERDSAGNLYLAWYGAPSYGASGDILMQKIGPGGNRLWNVNIPVNSIAGSARSSSTGSESLDISTDGLGSMYVAWHDGRNGGRDLYAQKVDGNGYRRWSVDLPVCITAGSERKGVALAIGTAGAFYVAWTDTRDDYGDIYLLKFNSAGNRLWEAERRINTDSGQTEQGRPTLASWQGTLILAWTDHGSGLYHLYAQMLDESGERLWPTERGISTVGAYNIGVHATPDAVGGFFVTWAWRQYGWQNFEIHAQRINHAEPQAWGPTGLRVSSGAGTARQQASAIAVTDDAHLYTVWVDSREVDPGATSDYGWLIYAQKHDSFGTPLWENYVQVCDSSARVSEGTRPKVIAGDSGQVWITWFDERSGARGTYLQMLDSAGNRVWPQDHLVASTDQGLGYNLSETDEYLYMVWSDYIRGNILVQKLDGSGQSMWVAPKIANDPSAAGITLEHPVVDVNAAGDIYVGWNTRDSVGAGDIYTQRLDVNGNRTWAHDLQVNKIIVQKSQWLPDIAAHEDGASVAWVNFSGGSWTELGYYVQRLDNQGRIQWPSEVQLDAPKSSWGTGFYVRLTADNSGNTYAAYNQGESGIYAQKLDRSGQLLWSKGTRVDDNVLKRWHSAPAIAYAASGRVYMAWNDKRGTDEDVYAQVLDGEGRRLWFGDLRMAEPDAHFLPYSVARSVTVDSLAEPIRSATLVADHVLNGGDALYFLSNDGGVTWENVIPGVAHQFSASGSDLRWQILLWPNPAKTLSAIVRSLRIEYSTALPYADDYEPDDTCATARPIAVNGAAQAHTFHQQADADWAWFDATAGVTYIVETRNVGARANTVIEPHATCTAPPTAGGRAFGPGYTISFIAPTSGRYYLKVYNHDPAASGADTGYTLSTRATQPSAVAVIIAGHDNAHSAQENITYAADRAYRVFRNAGIPQANIRYLAPQASHDADGDGTNDIAGPPTVANVRDTVQDWARERGVALGVPLYLYLVDHGLVDRFKANGDAVDRHITATELNLWLSNLEATSGTDNINVIIDACYSGSFIDETAAGPATISGRNRVVLASTTSDWLAFGPAGGQGLYFSNAFFSALENEQSLYASYLAGRQAVEAQDLLQRPWLDDNGDRRSDMADGALASDRALRRVALGGLSPRIEWVRGDARTGQILARVSDDSASVNVRGEVFAPSYVPPQPDGSGTTRIVDVPVVVLRDLDGDGVYAGEHNFTEAGPYHLVAHAQDAEGHLALPVQGSTFGGVQRVYLPLLLR